MPLPTGAVRIFEKAAEATGVEEESVITEVGVSNPDKLDDELDVFRARLATG